MAASTTPIVRQSLNQSLLDRYNSAPSIANVGGGSAKDAGTDKADVVNPTVQSIQKGFVERQPLQVTEFTDASLAYANKLGVSTVKYKG